MTSGFFSSASRPARGNVTFLCTCKCCVPTGNTVNTTTYYKHATFQTKKRKKQKTNIFISFLLLIFLFLSCAASGLRVAADGFSWSCASRRKEQLTALRSARKKKSDSKEMRVSRVVEREEEEEEKEKETG
jgi:hypothetical protein